MRTLSRRRNQTSRRLWRRLIAVVAALGLLASGAACTRLGGSGRTITVLIGLNSTYLKKQQDYFSTISREFEQKYGYQVEFRTYASSGEEQQQLQSSVISGSGPDVFALGTTFVPTAYATGAFHVLTEKDWKVLGGRGRFIQKQLTMSGPDRRKQIGIPYATQPYVMAYNTDMFRKAGISGPPQTWSQFMDDAKRLTKPDKGIYGVSTDPSDGFDPWKFIWMFTLQSGGRLISKDNSKALLNSSTVLNAAGFWFDWFTKQKIVDPASVTWQGTNSLAAFAEGKSAMQLMISADTIPTLNASPVKGKYAYAPMPTVPYGRASRPAGGLPAASIVSGQDYAIAQYSPNKDAALKLVNFLTRPKQQLLATRLFGDIPADAVAARKATAANPQLKAFMAAEPKSVPTAFSGAFGTLEISLQTAISQTIPSLSQGHYDRKALASRLSQINTQVQSALDEQRKAERTDR